jgi:colicin import membrane protein
MIVLLALILTQEPPPPPPPPRPRPPRPALPPDEDPVFRAPAVERAEPPRHPREEDARMREMEALRTRDPAAFEKMKELRRLERESQELAERVRAGEADAAKLKEALDKLFDLREEAKARELTELKRRVAELEKQLEARKAAKERIVDRRKRELLGERLPDEW